MTWVHASGQHDGGCQACEDDTDFGGTSPVCHDAQPSDDENPVLAAYCAWCGHTVEEVVVPAA